LWSDLHHFGVDEANVRSLGAACEHLTFQTRGGSFQIARITGHLVSICFAYHSFLYDSFQPFS
jgi:hypothetical protein